ncbi:MAG: hypothetical protein HQK52_23910 [Oligoflexia bacterium]|nr:hypothetical protein [Oligoflexia bacterium]
MSWSDACDSDKISYEALSMLYGQNENLFHFLMNPDNPRLTATSDRIKYNSGVLSSGEQLLIRVGLDIWDGSGGITFNELYQKLDEKNFQKIILVLLFLRAPKKAELY